MKWRNKRPSHVPKSWGPHVPGCCDIMTSYTKTGLFLRLYYPAESERNIDQLVSKWIPWLPDDSYLLGISKVLKLWLFIVRLVIWLMSGKIRVPTFYGAKVKTDCKLKCIILSHGLGGNRFLYSTTCIELASHGFLVAALEHRDESACHTYYYKSKSDVENDKKTFIEHLMVKLGNSHYSVRNKQVLKRSEECRKALDLLHDIHKGVVPCNVLSDLPQEADVEFDIKQLVGQMDLDNITMMGHSFGAATALVTLANEPRLSLGVLLDTWMFPVKDERLAERVTQPLLFVNTQTFHIACNVRALRPLLDMDARQMYTIRRTTHESQTDSVFVVGHWLNWFMGKLDAELAMRINNALVLRYLSQHTGCPEHIQRLDALLRTEAQNFYPGLTQPWA